jgi:uncharacterized protein YjbI with pentapeptide repeats
MSSTKFQHAILFSTLIITSSLAGCIGSDEDNNVISDYEDNLNERDQEIETLEAELANLTMNLTSISEESEEEIANLSMNVAELTGEIASLENQYSLLMMNYNYSVLYSENLSSQLIVCEIIFGPQAPTCLDAEGWYFEYRIKEDMEQNLSYALEYVEWMESHLVVHLIGVNLSGADLSFADLSDSVIVDSNLSGADLRWSFLNNSNLSGTDFSYAQLDEVIFGFDANITNVSFRGVNLGNVQFHRSISFDGVDFSDTIIGDNFDWSPVFYNVNFSGADFTQSDISSGSFDFVDLTYSNGLAWVSDGAYFENSDLTGATNAVPYGSYWFNTICPDGSNSDDNGNTCEGHGI